MLQAADWPQRLAIGGCEHTLAALNVVLVEHGVRFAASPSGSLPANPEQENTMVHNAMRQEQEPALEPVDPQIDHVRGSLAGHVLLEYGDPTARPGTRPRHPARPADRSGTPAMTGHRQMRRAPWQVSFRA